MSKLNTAVWLASVLGHLNRHPDVNGTVTSVLGYHRDITVGDTDDVTDLAALARWARSLAGVDTVTVKSVDDLYTHLQVVGALDDGTEVTITALLEDVESDLLAANTRVEKGTTFPTELLYRLTDATDAERRPAGAVSR